MPKFLPFLSRSQGFFNSQVKKRKKKNRILTQMKILEGDTNYELTRY